MGGRKCSQAVVFHRLYCAALWRGNWSLFVTGKSVSGLRTRSPSESLHTTLPATPCCPSTASKLQLTSFASASTLASMLTLSHICVAVLWNDTMYTVVVSNLTLPHTVCVCIPCSSKRRESTMSFAPNLPQGVAEMFKVWHATFVLN